MDKHVGARRFFGWLLVLLVAVALTNPVEAQERKKKKPSKPAPRAAAKPGKPTIVEDLTEGAKKMKDLGISASAQVQSIHGNNLTDFNDETSGTRSDSFAAIPVRLRLGWDFDITRSIGAFAEVQNYNVFGNKANIPNLGPFENFGTGENEGEVEFYQGYVELQRFWKSELNLKIGRQELVYGSEMLLGDADFYGGISHDAIKLNFSRTNFWVDAFYAKLVEGAETFGTFPLLTNLPDRDVDLWGLYGHLALRRDWALEGYWLIFNDRRANEPGLTPFDERRHTVGGRLAGEFTKTAGASAEFAYQFGNSDRAGVFTGGTVDEGDISAWAFEGDLYIKIPRIAINPKFGIKFALATGDEESTITEARDKDIDTFHPLFGDHHNRYGNHDLFILQNLFTVGPYVSFEQIPWGGGIRYNYYAVDSADDTTGDSNADDEDLLVVPITTRDPLVVGAETQAQALRRRDDRLGSGVDFWLTHQYSRQVKFEASWSMFFPDDFIERSFPRPNNSEATDDAWRLYIQMVLSF